MTRYLFTGGGTAGHVNPLLAVAELLMTSDANSEIIVLGTKEGLEANLVPQRGFRLETVPKLPFPRRFGRYAFNFPARYKEAVKKVCKLIVDERIDVVVGFGGYASAPAYSAAKKCGIPLILHEANASMGMANRLGVRYASGVALTYPISGISKGCLTGLPLRREIEQADRLKLRDEAYGFFELDPMKKTLLVTGGSQGALRINATVRECVEEILTLDWQILHIVGPKSEYQDEKIAGYRMLKYCHRMDLALAVADFAIARSGSATVAEFAFFGIPAVYVPLPYGNGEQRLNALEIIGAGGGILIKDADFISTWVKEHFLPVLSRPGDIEKMSQKSLAFAVRDASAQMLQLIRENS